MLHRHPIIKRNHLGSFVLLREGPRNENGKRESWEGDLYWKIPSSPHPLTCFKHLPRSSTVTIA